jgi:serine/alanine adding enzyme
MEADPLTAGWRIVAGEDIPRPEWARFVSGHPQGNAFQTPAMYDFWRAVDNHQPLAIACLDAAGQMGGLLLAVTQSQGRGWTRRFTARTIIWGGPLIRSDAAAERLLAELRRRVGRKSIYIEFRNLFDTAPLAAAFRNGGFVYREHLNFVVDTTDRSGTEKRVSKSRLRQIRKGLAAGAEIVVADSLDQVRQFYQILSDLYRRKVRRPLPGWSFFENFFLLCRSGGPGVCLLVRYQGRIVGGILCPILAGRAIYEWYVCGLDEAAPDIHPSVLATWAAIDYALKQGIPAFDFLGAGPPERDYGVRDFKARFGGRLVSWGRHFRANDRFLYWLGKTSLWLYRRVRRP